MLKVLRTAQFIAWLNGLKDAKAVAIIATRINRLEQGNRGDCDSVGGGVQELRIHYGPGYRVYFVQQGGTIAIVLGGGTKRTQTKDISAAKGIAAQLR